MKSKDIKKTENQKYYNPTYHREYYVQNKQRILAGVSRESWDSMSKQEKELHLKKRKLKDG